MRSKAQAGTFAILLSLGGCVSSPSPLVTDDPCGGTATAFDDCVHGAAWAECGDAGGEPTFACGLYGCFWFAGCVADGYVASACPSDDVCCETTANGRGWVGVGNPSAVATLTVGWGLEPWDRDRDASLVVTTGAPSSGARPAIACTQSTSFRGVCTATIDYVGRLDSVDDGVWVVRLHDNSTAIAGTEVVLEIIPETGAATHARVCITPTTDFAEASCQTAGGRVCATSGTVTIASLPSTTADASSLGIDVDATMADGSSMMLRL